VIHTAVTKADKRCSTVCMRGALARTALHALQSIDTKINDLDLCLEVV